MMTRCERAWFVVALATSVVACSSSSSSSSSDGTTTTGTRADAGAGASCNGDEGGAVPTTPPELLTWLNKRLYTCWAHESVQHASTGPHAGEVKTFLNSKLDTSLARAGENAEGSVAVKEFYAKGGTEITGWAVSVKTQAASASGKGIYWYEVFGTTPAARTNEGQGAALCVGCHSTGKDYLLTPYPLR